jgi:predicted nucleotidyltransferase
LAKLLVAKLTRHSSPHSFEVEAFGIRFNCIDLPTLIRIKEAAGRRKDQEAIAELRVLLEEIEKKARLKDRRRSRWWDLATAL